MCVCVCVRAGQYGGGLPCPVNFYCPAGNVPNPTWVPVACPANTFSAAGAKDVYDCQVDIYLYM